MNPRIRIVAWSSIVIGVALVALTAGSASAQTPEVDQRLAALKASLQSSRKQLTTYEWVETTVVTVDGEETSRTQDSCYYGADGTLQKIPIAGGTESAAQPHGLLGRPGLRGRIAERRSDDVESYMQQAVALIKQYVPPDPTVLQARRDEGKLTIDLIDPGKRAQLDFHDYVKSGDVLGVEIDLTNNRILGLNVSSYIQDPSDSVSLKVVFKSLDDGTTYPASTTLNATAKKVQVDVENTGYRKM
jgi:hypothetical protein